MRRLNWKGILAMVALGFVLGIIARGIGYDAGRESYRKRIKAEAVKIALDIIREERKRDEAELERLKSFYDRSMEGLENQREP